MLKTQMAKHWELLALGILLATAGCKPSAVDTSAAKVALDAQDPATEDTGCNSDALPYGGGTGTYADPYLVCSAQQMQNVDSSQYLFFSLTQDIDLSGIQVHPITLWGGFHGNGHRISNITIESSAMDKALFKANYGSIDNVEIENALVNGSAKASAFVIYNYRNGLIQNITIVNANVTGGTMVGGIVAENAGRVLDCTSYGDMHGNYDVGGIVGMTYSTSDVERNTMLGSERHAHTGGWVFGYQSGTSAGNR